MSARTEKVKEHIPEILKKAKRAKQTSIKPTKEYLMKAVKVVENYLKKTKRKIYGGSAMQKNLELKDPKIKISDEDDIPDYDIYSPFIVEDVFTLTNLLHKAGFEYVKATEAQHFQTFKIFVFFEEICDISYMPKYMYDHLPTIVSNGLHYVGVEFLMIDVYRQYTDPINSYDYRLEKIYNRGSLLEKYYPFKKPDKKYVQDKINPEVAPVLKTIFDKFIKGNDEIILVGPYAYNTFVRKSKLDLIKDTVNHFKIISLNYQEDIEKLKKLIKDPEIKEYYRYYQFYDEHVEFYYKNHRVLNLYNRLGKCIPVKRVLDNSVTIGSYHYVLLFLYILLYRVKTEKDKNKYLKYRWLVYNFIDLRKKYLKKHNLVGIENDLFQELQVHCIGDTMNFGHVSRIKRHQRYKERKFPVSFTYDPSAKIQEASEFGTMVFPNESGNLVRRKIEKENKEIENKK